MKIFISHGHNELVRLKLKQFISERLKHHPVVLADEPDDGLTIVEKLEKYGADCDFALIVLTKDDKTAGGGLRARQNVIHELGFFHGHLGRKRVLLLKQRGVELFSNISGLIYKEFDGDDIDPLFEDIRRSIESRDASKHAESVPPKSETAFFEGTHKILEGSIELDDCWKKTQWEKISNLGAKLDDPARVSLIKTYLENQLESETQSLARIQETLESRNGKELSDGEALSQLGLVTLVLPTEKHVRLLRFSVKALNQLEASQKSPTTKQVLALLKETLLEANPGSA